MGLDAEYLFNQTLVQPDTRHLFHLKWVRQILPYQNLLILAEKELFFYLIMILIDY